MPPCTSNIKDEDPTFFKDKLQAVPPMKHEISEGKMLGSSAIPNEKQISIPLEVEGKFEGTAKEMCIETTKTDDDALRAPLMRRRGRFC